MTTNSSKKSFTLVEMILVVVFLGILAGAMVPVLVTAGGRARDSQRKYDANTVSTSLALYYNDYQKYPISYSNCNDGPYCQNSGVALNTPNGFEYSNGSGGFLKGLIPEYLKRTVADPLQSGNFATINDQYSYRYINYSDDAKDLIMSKCEDVGSTGFELGVDFIQFDYFPENPTWGDFTRACPGGTAFDFAIDRTRYNVDDLTRGYFFFGDKRGMKELVKGEEPPQLIGTGSTPIDGVCGTATGSAYITTPTTNLCQDGLTPSTISGANGIWTWTCVGANSGTNASCASKETPACGTANGQSYEQNATIPTPYCARGTASTTPTSATVGTQSWSCSQFSATASCSLSVTAPAPIDTSVPGVYHDVANQEIIVTDGTNVYTMMDKNVGATQVGTDGYNAAIRGSYFQWGNNHGFTTVGTATPNSTGQVDTSTYNGTNPYNNSTWIYGTTLPRSDWSLAQNDNLRPAKTQGPCPTGYHIPTQAERQGLYNTWLSLNPQGANGNLFRDTLRLPMAGFRVYEYASSVNFQGSWGYYWSSTPNGQSAGSLYLYASAVNPGYANVRAYGFSVRCFKNSTSPAPVNGVCGSATGSAYFTSPTTNLCQDGSTPARSAGANGIWTWTCLGANGGTNASCTSKETPACGTASGQSYEQNATIPLPYCARGTSNTGTISTATAGTKSWTCTQFSATASCSLSVTAPAPVNGVCGTATGSAYITSPTTNLCQDGSTPARSAGANGTWTWTCLGANGGTNASCTSKETPACGTASGQSYEQNATIPTPYCARGTASTTPTSTTVGTQSWTCGLNSATATCSLSVTAPALSGDACFTFSAGTISAYNDACTKALVIPATIGGVAVKTIGASAFEGKGLTSLTLPTSLITISSRAFYNNNITSITIPSTSNATVGNEAFRYNKLTSIKLTTTKITSLGTDAFTNNGPGKNSLGISDFKARTITSWYLNCDNWIKGTGSPIACPVPPVCGTANGQSYLQNATIPTPYCATGTASGTPSSATPGIQSWTCANDGLTANCSLSVVDINAPGIHHVGNEIVITDGTNTYTMMDKNLGASVAGTGQASYGRHFQRGNNFGFWNGVAGYTNEAGNATIDTTTTLVSSPSVGYKNSTFVIVGYTSPFYWATPRNPNLRLVGGQGPCPSGYHIPTQAEWQGVINVRASLPGKSTSNITLFSTDLKLPMVGYRQNNDATLHGQGWMGSYWSSSPAYTDIGIIKVLRFYESPQLNVEGLYIPMGLSMRCFKGSPALANAVCGTATLSAYVTTRPTTNKCQDGSEPITEGGTSVGELTWTCLGINGGTNTSCKTKETPACGAINMKLYEQNTTIPLPYCARGTSNTGTISTATVGTKSWSCSQFNATANCSLTVSPGGRGVRYVGNEIVVTDGITTYTIMDKNLGASVAGTGQASYGRYFQRGNNFGFWNGVAGYTNEAGNATIDTTTTLVSSPSVGYKNSTFVLNNNTHRWTTETNRNDKLRIEGVQGPCPIGYHIPTFDEWRGLTKVRASLPGKGTTFNISYANGFPQSTFTYYQDLLSNDLKLPRKGGVYASNGAAIFSTFDLENSAGHYWTTTPISFYNRTLYFTKYGVGDYNGSYGSVGLPIRCFKNP